MVIFRFLQDGGCPPSWICDACFGTTHERRLVVFMTVQNLVVLIICTFFDFTSLALKLFTSQNWGFDPLNGEPCEQIPKRCILARRLSHHV